MAGQWKYAGVVVVVSVAVTLALLPHRGLAGAAPPAFPTPPAAAGDAVPQADGPLPAALTAGQPAHELTDTQRRALSQVDRVSRAIVRQAVKLRPETARWHWRVKLFPTGHVSAYAMAGGEIGVFSGLIEWLRPTDDELAQLVAHEVARALTGVPDSAADSVDPDRLGLELAARAGFDPRAALSVLQRVRALPGTHRLGARDAGDVRLREIRRALPSLLEIYRANARRMVASAERTRCQYPSGEASSAASPFSSTASARVRLA